MALTKERRKQYLEIMLWCLAAAYFCIELLQFGQTVKRMIVVGGVCAISVLIHAKRTWADSDYGSGVLGLKQKAGRDYRYDWLRCLAVMMVILTHAVQADLHEGFIQDERAEFVLTVFYMLCLACNLIYVMLSGALLLPYKEESAWKFYVKRISTVALPMGIYYVFYMWQARELDGHIPWGTIRDLLLRLCQGTTPESPHYWLMYVLLSIYLAVPFFRYMFRNMPYKVLTGLVGISMALMALDLFCPIALGISSFLGKWEGIAIMGYWVTRPETKKYYHRLVGLGLAAFGVMVAMIGYGLDYRTLCANHSPVMALICMGMFAFVLENRVVFERGNAGLRILGKYSYSLILVHWWALYGIVREKYQIHVGQYCGGGLFLTLILTLLVSLIASVLIDNLIVMPVQLVFAGGMKKVETLGAQICHRWKKKE